MIKVIQRQFRTYVKNRTWGWFIIIAKTRPLIGVPNPEEELRLLEEKAKAAMKWMTDNAEEGSNKGSLHFELCDLSSTTSVKNCADRLLNSLKKIDILVNNAGIGGPGSKITTEDGFEVTFATNHLGHFLLTNLLLPLVKKS